METLLNVILILNIFQNCVEARRHNREDVPHFRIFNGENAIAGQFPYQVALKQELQSAHALRYITFCGGSIINPKKVLSAAHCFMKDKSFWEVIFNVPAWRKMRSLKTLYVVAGSLTNQHVIKPPRNLNFTALDKHDFDTEQWRRARKIKVLDKYYGSKLDVAVVILKHAFTFDKNVAPIPLATEKKDYTGLKCLASGYGRIGKNDNKEALSLQWAQFAVVPTEQCSEKYDSNMKKFVCVESTVSDVRPGDSGGPLVCFKTGDPKETNEGILVGIACAITTGRPSIFTRVTYYLDFINKWEPV